MGRTGRPRNFDRDVAVTEALHLFWEQGYESTTLSQLKAAMGGGICAPSLYSAFGSKEALFQEAVASYLTSYGPLTACLWDHSLAPRQALEMALRQSATMQCEPGHPKGCMVALGVMSASSPASREVTRQLTESRAHTRAGIVACIERGMESGHLAPNTHVPSMAAVFDSFLLGISSLARDGYAHRTLDASITRLMSVWDAAALQPT